MAEGYALEAISNEEQIGRPDKLAMAYGKACDVYHALGRDSTALGYADMAVAIADKDMNETTDILSPRHQALLITLPSSVYDVLVTSGRLTLTDINIPGDSIDLSALGAVSNSCVWHAAARMAAIAEIMIMLFFIAIPS